MKTIITILALVLIGGGFLLYLNLEEKKEEFEEMCGEGECEDLVIETLVFEEKVAEVLNEAGGFEVATGTSFSLITQSSNYFTFELNNWEDYYEKIVLDYNSSTVEIDSDEFLEILREEHRKRNLTTDITGWDEITAYDFRNDPIVKELRASSTTRGREVQEYVLDVISHGRGSAIFRMSMNNEDNNWDGYNSQRIYTSFSHIPLTNDCLDLEEKYCFIRYN